MPGTVRFSETQVTAAKANNTDLICVYAVWLWVLLSSWVLLSGSAMSWLCVGVKCGNVIPLLCPLPSLEVGKGVCGLAVSQSNFPEVGNMKHWCPTGKAQPSRFNPSSQSPNYHLMYLPEQKLGLYFMCSAVSVCKITESVCSGGFWIQPLKTLNLPSGPLKRSLLSPEYQLCDTICRMRAEKLCVSKWNNITATSQMY